MNEIKKYLAFVTLILSLYTEGVAQVAINTDGSAASPNTMLDLNPAIGKAFVPPKMNWSQIKAISPATEGMTVYDTEYKTLRLYNGTKWVSLTQTTDGSATAQAPTGTVIINGVKTDASGNVYITGSFVGTATFGTVSVTGSGSCKEFFLAKYNNTGVVNWVQKSTSNQTSSCFAEGVALTLDVDGNIYVTGGFSTNPYPSANLVFGSLPSIWSFPSDGFTGLGGDIFIVKYNNSGVAQWSIREGGEGKFDDFGTSIAVDASSNIYVAGSFCPNPPAVPVGVSIGGTVFLPSNGLNNAFIAKYNSSGAPQWGRNVDSNNSAEGTGVAIDGSGSVYLSGYFSGNAIYNGTTTSSSGSYDGFILKFNNAGTFQWFKKAGGAGDDFVSAITVDGAGDLYATGSFSNTATFSTSPSITLTSGGATDIFITKYNTSGVAQWAKKAGGTGSDGGYSLTIDGTGNIFMTGSFTGTATFGTLPSLTSAGNTDVFVAKYNSSGTEQWVQKAGGTGADRGSSIAVDALGNIYTVGPFVPTAQFGNTTLTAGQSFLMKSSE